MSRIGKKPIILPAGVEATLKDGSIDVRGPKGALSIDLNSAVKVTEQTEPRSLEVTVKHPENPGERAVWGLTRQLISNMVDGVQKPFEKSLEFIGVGFKLALVSADTLKFEVGFSHPVEFKLPKGIEAKVEKQVLTLSGCDKRMVGEIAAQIRRVKPPEPYKGKGIKYTTEVIKRKAGKAATKGA